MSFELDAFRLLDARLEHYDQLLENSIHALRRGRGDTLSQVMLRQLILVRDERKAIAAESDESVDNRELVLLSRRQQRLKVALDGIYENLSWAGAAIGRQDIPVGLLHMIDTLAADIIGGDVDPLVCLDPINMYRCIPTLDVIARGDATTSDPRNENDNDPDSDLRVFLLPAQGPCNILLSPIIAHEAAHSRVDEEATRNGRTTLTSEVLNRIDLGILQETFGNTTAANMAIISAQGWIEELLCDAVATAITGPSHVLALAAFLPALTEGGRETHPSTPYRIASCMRVLEELGWRSFLSDRTPNVLEWLDEISARSDPHPSAALESIISVTDILLPHIEAVAIAFGTDYHFCYQAAHEPVLDFALESLRENIPPIEHNDNPIEPWIIVLAGWLFMLETEGDAIKAVAHAPTETRINNMLLKAIELSSIQRLWRQA